MNIEKFNMLQEVVAFDYIKYLIEDIKKVLP